MATQDELANDSLVPRETQVFKTELLATVSHELRSPLTAIKGYVATLLRHGRSIPRKERHEYLVAIVAASDRLEHIVERFLELSQLETGAIRIERFDACDAIAMATHGGSNLAYWVMGSVTERILHGSKLPLLIVRPKG